MLRLSEWDDVYAQVPTGRRAAASCRRPASKLRGGAPLVARGLLHHVGVRGEEGEYLGTRGVRFHIFPGSPLAAAQAQVGDGRLYRRDLRVYRAARGRESSPLGSRRRRGTCCNASISSPTGTRAREQVVARERITFLGLTLSANRIVNYGPIAPEESRLIFAREALVYGRLEPAPGVALGQ